MITREVTHNSNELTSEVWNSTILSTKYQPTLLRLIWFEFNSLYGRLALNKKPKIYNQEKKLLNLGCGSSYFEDWTNADFFHIFKLPNQKQRKLDWMLDLRFPMNCENNTWDGVFTEHTLEHLYPIQVLNLLQELNRTMKSGAWLRVTVPDLEKYVKYYCAEKVDEKFSKWGTGCEAIRTLTQDYGHISVWDSQLLKHFLTTAGFINVNQVDFMQGSDNILLKDKKERNWETLYMEAQKP